MSGQGSGYALVTAENIQYDDVVTGELIAGTVAAVMGTVDASLFWFKAYQSNSGTIYIGKNDVTTPNGTADATTGRPLGPGDEWGPIPITNLSVLSLIASAAGQQLSYFGVR